MSRKHRKRRQRPGGDFGVESPYRPVNGREGGFDKDDSDFEDVPYDEFAQNGPVRVIREGDKEMMDAEVPEKVEPTPAAWSVQEKRSDICVTKCAHTDDLKATWAMIVLSKEVNRVIDYLREKICVEWQLLLKGQIEFNEEKGQIAVIDGYYIPTQEVTGSSVKNLDCIDRRFIEENRIIATIHSHSDMATFFSPTDKEECCASQIPFHMVTNNRGDILAAHTVALPCGKLWLNPEVEVFFDGEQLTTDPEGFDRITKTSWLDRRDATGEKTPGLFRGW